MAKEQDFNVEKGFNLEGYDQADIDEAQKGKIWDSHDQERYDALLKKRGGAKEKAQEVQTNPSQQTEESSTRAQELLADKMPVNQPTGESDVTNLGEFNVTNRINQASANVQKKVQADAEYDRLDKNVSNMSEFYRNQSDKTKLGLFGDMWNTRSFEWKPAGDLAKIETTYNKKDEDEDEK